MGGRRREKMRGRKIKIQKEARKKNAIKHV